MSCINLIETRGEADVSRAFGQRRPRVPALLREDCFDESLGWVPRYVVNHHTAFETSGALLDFIATRLAIEKGATLYDAMEHE